MNRDELVASICQHEGFSGTPYPDMGDVSIGYGRNLTRNPLTHEEGVALMRPQLEAAMANAPQIVNPATWPLLGEARQNVLAEMVYNLGFYGTLKFKRMRAALEAQDWEGAAKEMLQSSWAGQVGQRAIDLAEQMRTGIFS